MLYPHFSDFMTAAIRRAEPKIGLHSGSPIILRLIEMGWSYFASIALAVPFLSPNPLAILRVGNEVKAEYESLQFDDDAVSRLLERTADRLIEECKY